MRTLPCLALAFCLVACAHQSAAPTRTFALDHVWIAVPPGAAAARAALEQAGFRIAPSPNHHDGQGTTSQTVEFENGFLELIYADDAVPVDAAGAAVKQRFIDRANWRSTGASPFGVQLARTAQTPAAFPFETWRVSAAWMAPGEYLEILTPRGSPALTLSISPHATDETANRVAIAAAGADAWRFLHPNGARRLTGVRVVAPGAASLPPSAGFVRASGAAKLDVGHAWLMEVTLDEGRQHQARDLRPALPVIMRY